MKALKTLSMISLIFIASCGKPEESTRTVADAAYKKLVENNDDKEMIESLVKMSKGKPAKEVLYECIDSTISNFNLNSENERMLLKVLKASMEAKDVHDLPESDTQLLEKNPSILIQMFAVLESMDNCFK